MSHRLKTRLLVLALSPFILSACGGGGSSGTTEPFAGDTIPPVLNFEPATLQVASGGTADSVFSATDNFGIRTGPNITCTEGGSFADDTFTAPAVSLETVSTCTATGADAAGNMGSATLTVTILAPNQAPTAAATASKSIISEGQPIVLDASGSNDPEDTDLTYSWTQIGGPDVILTEVDNAVLEIDAPALDADATLIFEVTVSDGEDQDSQSISIDVENLETLTVAGSTPPNTFGFFVAQIAGITAPATGGFRTHWSADSFTTASFTGSQLFDENLEEIGSESTAKIRSPGAGRLVQATQSGSRTYYIFQTQDFVQGGGRRFGFSVLSDRPEGESEGLGSLIADGPELGSFPLQIVSHAYSNERLVSVVLSTGFDQQPVQLDSFIHAADGSQIRTTIAGPSDSGIGGNAVAQADETSYVVTWTQGTSDPMISQLLGRRVTQDGNQTENIINIGDPLGSSFLPVMTQLSDGRILVVWGDRQNFETNGTLSIMGRILRPDGTFDTEIQTLFTTDENIDLIQQIKVAPMDAGGALITWTGQNRRDFGDGMPQINEVTIQALALDETATPVSNVFDIYREERGPEDDALMPIDDFAVAVSVENRAVIGWNFKSLNLVENSFYADFYPVGK